MLRHPPVLTRSDPLFPVPTLFRSSLIVVAIYGGYFNGGLGIVLLALFACWGMRDLDQMNVLKSAISLLISGTSVATFALVGLVAWPQELVMKIGRAHV